MTEVSFPFGNASVAQPVTDAQWGQLMALLGPASGVSASGDLLVTRTSGLGLQVAAGSALVAGMMYTASAPLPTVTLATADPSNPRIDLVILRRVITVGSTLGSVTVQTLTGTPAASPVAPALTQSTSGTFELALCQVTVPAAAAALVDANLADQRITVWGATARALLSAGTVLSAREALHIYKGTGPGTPQTDDLRYRDA